MKHQTPLYWQSLRQRSLEKRPIKRSPIKTKAVKIAKVGKAESLGRLIQRAVTIFHKWIRERDSKEGMFECISCWKYLPVDQMQAGHYLNAGNNGVIRLHENNIHSQCWTCNNELHGNQDNYRVGLIRKIGLEKVEALEAQAKKAHKWDRSDLQNLIDEYSLKLK